MIEVCFDIETKKFFEEIESRDPAGLGISIISVLRREIDSDGKIINEEMKSFWDPFGEPNRPKSTKEEMDLMWGWFDEADRIIGFNSLGFDVPALAPIYPNGDFKKLPHFDIIVKVKEAFVKRVSLQAIVRETLWETKTASGGDAVEYWAKGDKESLEKLRIYCEKDVEATMKVYDYGMKNKKLRFKDHWNELREIEVDFSYPKIEPKSDELQMGLF
jgi:DEAD/DEAH box helicase domain-containing protein